LTKPLRRAVSAIEAEEAEGMKQKKQKELMRTPYTRPQRSNPLRDFLRQQDALNV
jgi:hypothetical protein